MKPAKFWFSQFISLCAFAQMIIWMNHDICLALILTAIVLNSIFMPTDISTTRREKIISATIGSVLLVLSIPLTWGKPIAFFHVLSLFSLIIFLTSILRRRPAAQTPLHN
jgi:hypothetical protein